jgi:hypothetical protein
MPPSLDLSVPPLLFHPDRHPDINRGVVLVSAVLLSIVAIALAQMISVRQAVLFLIGGAGGISLYHASFGFTAAWRAFIKERRGAGLRAQMLMFALSVLVFFPLLAGGTAFGQPVKGELGAVGLSVVVGAFLFGVGMQWGGGCASGTLYTVGGGNSRMLVTLAAFIAGSLIGTAHFSWWAATPNIGPVSLIGLFGWPVALALNLVLFGTIAALSIFLERRRHGTLATPAAAAVGPAVRLWRGPWPLAWGALGLVLVNIATLLVAGRPWGVTSGFALWGAKAALALGVDVGAWSYWSVPARAAMLNAPLANDVTSVMDAGIVLGAMLAAGLAGKFAPAFRIPARSLAAAVIGGLLMGYGARLAYGCNIGAYFSGIASGSLHGWLWAASALAGSVLGVRTRPLFRLDGNAIGGR